MDLHIHLDELLWLVELNETQVHEADVVDAEGRRPFGCCVMVSNDRMLVGCHVQPMERYTIAGVDQDRVAALGLGEAHRERQ